MARRPTVYDVAQLAGVSIATVSFAFTKPERVKSETLRAVLRAADSIGYVPSANARGLAKGKTGALGLYAFDYLLEPAEEASSSHDAARVPDGRLFPLYSDEVQRGVQLECRRRGYALMLGSGRNPGHLPSVIDVAGRVDGLIAFAGAAPGTLLEQISARIPVVELGGEIRREGMHTVYVDNRDAMARLTRHLLADHAYRHFAYLGELGTPEFVARYEGFSQALHEAGIAPPPPLSSHPGDDQTTVDTVRSLLGGPPVPRVLVCATDQEALVAIDVLRGEGIGVPSQVAVTGFDGILAGRLITPHLTTVRQPMEQIGRVAVRILLDALQTGEGADRHEVLTSAVWPGGTCGCPGA
ncbi:LacI family transcriptional regulator [Nonomuraea sp. 3-1Str]|uniref:LacI family DNA-binding transcriptional regulator n=1 Tax=Nonomuraea sp. 3-1Str TaxID=2929801 RepID=UPI0028547511|nr:LacI family DNA-binding transcriptional regulator [Nonomuraea sp. 3-1Str]MDR8411992.1 LacI family transcriptional regulator [Nonomuraea sp. 3-1Str]